MMRIKKKDDKEIQRETNVQRIWESDGDKRQGERVREWKRWKSKKGNTERKSDK